LYHLNAEEEPELPDYPKDPEFKKKFGPRGVLHCLADGKGGQTITDTGPLTTGPNPGNAPERLKSTGSTEGRTADRAPRPDRRRLQKECRQS
jgi:hypothetical protein